MTTDRGEAGSLRREGRQVELTGQGADGCGDIGHADADFADGQQPRNRPLARGDRRVRVTGDQLKRYLEHGALHYLHSWEPELYDKDVPIYNYDMLDGVSYALDLGQPVGSRVLKLSYQGQPVKPDQSFTVAISTYRLRGGGGYMAAMGYTGAPELITKASQRNLILEHVLGRPTLNPIPTNSWRTIPYLDRERVMSLAR